MSNHEQNLVFDTAGIEFKDNAFWGDWKTVEMGRLLRVIFQLRLPKHPSLYVIA